MKNDNFDVAKKLNWLKKFFLLKKKGIQVWIWQFLAKKVWQNIFWQNFLAQKKKLAFFFAKNLKLARHRNWQKHENCIFGQLVLICWPFEHLLHTQNINIIADLGGCWWGYDQKRRVKALQTGFFFHYNYLGGIFTWLIIYSQRFEISQKFQNITHWFLMVKFIES